MKGPGYEVNVWFMFDKGLVCCNAFNWFTFCLDKTRLLVDCECIWDVGKGILYGNGLYLCIVWLITAMFVYTCISIYTMYYQCMSI